MELADYLTPERVVLLAGSTKAEALGQLAEVLASTGAGVSREELEEAFWRREKMMSTGIGHGLAVPHVRLPGASDLSMAVGVSPSGLADYESLDEEPVRIVAAIVAPQGQHEAYIRLLAEVIHVLKDPQARRAIIEAGEPGRIYEMLVEHGG